MIKILILSPNKPGNGYGGAEQHLRDLANIFEMIGADVKFLSHDDAPVVSRSWRVLIKCIPLLRSYVVMRQLSKSSLIPSSDIVLSVELMGDGISHERHLHLFFGSYAGFRRMALPSSKYLSVIHRWTMNYLATILERRTQGKIGAIANSIGLRDVLSKYGIPVRTEVIVPPTNTDHFFPGSKSRARELLGVSWTKRLVLFCGRWEYAKGADRVLGVIDVMPSDWAILLVCPSLSSASWPDHPRVFKVLDVDHLLMPEVYRAADVLIQPSRFEGYSLVVSEAQATGCPVVTSNIGQAWHLLNADSPVGDGVVFTPDDPTSWIDSINRILGKFDEKAFAASHSARKFALSTVSYKAVSDQWRDFFTSVFPELPWKKN